MAKDESRRDRWVKASQRLRNAFQMAAVYLAACLRHGRV